MGLLARRLLPIPLSSPAASPCVALGLRMQASISSFSLACWPQSQVLKLVSRCSAPHVMAASLVLMPQEARKTLS